MHRSELSWDDVRVFLALCRSRTVADAARAVAVDASTISRRLAAIERALSATLFDRGRSGVMPLQAAIELLPVAEEMEAAMTRFAREAERLEHEISGVVRITCPPDVAEIYVTPVLGALFDQHPRLRVELAPGEALVDLGRHEADIALRTVRPERGDLVVTRLAEARWQIYAAPRLASALGTLQAWEHARWIGWSERLAHVSPARWLASHAPGIEPVLRSESLRVQLAAIERGVGIGLVPSPSASHHGLVPITLAASLRKDADAWPIDELLLVTHRALRNVPRVRVVWDALLGARTEFSAPSRGRGDRRDEGRRRDASRSGPRAGKRPRSSGAGSR